MFCPLRRQRERTQNLYRMQACIYIPGSVRTAGTRQPPSLAASVLEGSTGEGWLDRGINHPKREACQHLFTKAMHQCLSAPYLILRQNARKIKEWAPPFSRICQGNLYHALRVQRRDTGKNTMATSDFQPHGSFPCLVQMFTLSWGMEGT